ncbi:GCN5-related N-acetyltransferase (GNAT) domain-containingprotein [Purpureocillium lavendulum]|uniref:GCN5-related N-acetyltransferase (GNAT) domain-containingprotein n=1 Tax=Purpureocillium lavendulum TaxID=1247861 RepID=A0AB34FWE8_9HYPO|nr:GCN5-related N-acetyltransferase (GNAT) domain-containingprotein [Purpureocillium lavendulum]
MMTFPFDIWVVAVLSKAADCAGHSVDEKGAKYRSMAAQSPCVQTPEYECAKDDGVQRCGSITAPVKYIPSPTWTPPAVRDPFPALAAATSPPSIPRWNVPKPDLHTHYGLDYQPPLFIGFTRTWPILLQAVVSYITAGWPPSSIHVVENTGVQRANAEGKLSQQNPFFLNHTQLQLLGVNVVRAPVLMNFAQLQNYFTYLAGENDWPWYFWSHMDVLVLSYEDGLQDVTPRAGEEGYKTVYELCLAELNATRYGDDKDRWADRFFAYDHLTLVNRAAYEDVGGWDTFIPYYMNDCDMHSRLLMRGWTQRDARAGIVTDVSAVLDDFGAFYREPGVNPSFTDPNPPPPQVDENDEKKDKRAATESHIDDNSVPPNETEYWIRLRETANSMFHYKHGSRGRNTWQLGQQGGSGEPFYYPARGVAEAIDVLTEAGREVFRRKWGHRDCDLLTGTSLKAEDQWRVEKDW